MHIAQRETSARTCEEPPGAGTFEPEWWCSRCVAFAEEATRSCGLSHDLYVQLFSSSVEIHLRGLAQDARGAAIAIARQFDYATPEELAQRQVELAAMGSCSHGIDRDCCPAGCGDLYYGDEDAVYEDPADHPDAFDYLYFRIVADLDMLRERFDREIEAVFAPLLPHHHQQR